MNIFFFCLIQRRTWMRSLLATLLLVLLASIAGGRQSGERAGASDSPSVSHQGPAKQRSGSDRGGTLTGRVVDEGGQPLSGASVFATPAGITSSSSSLAALNVRSGLTDDTGRFVLEGLGAGAYTLTGFVPAFVSEASTPGQSVYYRPGDSATLRMVKGGVITGVVTSSSGEPIAGIRVRATMVKDANGGPARPGNLTPIQLFQDWKTDDRGVYRIFGLEPGSYLVSGGGRGMMNLSNLSIEGYDNDAPTFYPSATRDTAVEVKVRGGEEANAIDIRYREGRGHAISGLVSGKVTLTSYSALMVTLTNAATHGVLSFSIGLFNDAERSFMFDGVPDGQYDLVAAVGYQTEDMMSSRPRRVEVRGADVTGVELALGPVASISGRLVLEKAQGVDPKVCPPASKSAVPETVLVARLDGRGKEPLPSSSITSALFSQIPDGVPDEKGEFKIRPLETGRYRLIPDLPGENTFVRAITLPAATQSGKPVDAAKNGIDLKPGERRAGLTVTVAEGAASVAGRVVPSKSGASLPSNLRVHLVPAEKETDDEVLRFFESSIDKDGAFSFKHVAPGRYFLLPMEEAEPESLQAAPRPSAWRGAAHRAKLRRDAEAFNVAIPLSQCQRVTDQILRYSPAQPAIAPPR